MEQATIPPSCRRDDLPAKFTKYCPAPAAERRDGSTTNHCGDAMFRAWGGTRDDTAATVFSKSLKIYLKSDPATLNHFHTWDDK
jgi:hypothetical protein